MQGLLQLLNLEDIKPEDIRKMIEPYDIFEDSSTYASLLNADNGEGIQRVVSQRATAIFNFRYCNYPNEIYFNSSKSILKTGSRPGVLVISDTPVLNSCVVKFVIAAEGKPGQGTIGFGLCDKSCLNYCPFHPSRGTGLFAAYYTSRKQGCLNMGDLGDKFISPEYDRPFGVGDSVHLAVDLDNCAVSFGINDVTLPDKRLSLKKAGPLYLAVWISDTGDEVRLVHE